MGKTGDTWGSFGGAGALDGDFSFFTDLGARFGGITSAEYMDFNRLFDQFTIEMSFAVEAGEGTQEVMEYYWRQLSDQYREIYTAEFSAAGLEGERMRKLRAFAGARNAIIGNVVGIGMSTLIMGAMAYSFCADLGICGENKEALETFKKTEQRTAQLKEAVQDEYHRLTKLKQAALSMRVNDCNVRVSDLEQTVYLCSQYFSDKTVADLGVEMPKEIELNGTTTQFSYDLSVALADACRRKDAGYESYQEDFDVLQEQFALVCNMLMLEDGADPLTALDQAYANVDNFSTTSYMEKRAYRLHLSNVVQKAMDLIRWYKLASYQFELDDDGKLVVITNEDGDDIYPVNQSTVDTTLDDLGQMTLLRLAIEEEPLDMFGKLTKMERESGIDNETVVKNSEEYKRYYDIFKDLQTPGMAEKMAMSAIMQNYPELVNQNFHYVVAQRDLSGYSNKVFAEQVACFEIKNMHASERFSSNDTSVYIDGNSHWGTRTYFPLEAYVQDPGSELRHIIEAAKPYCYSLHTTVSLVDNCYSNDDVFRAYTNFTDLEVSEFLNRVEDSGRTLLEELENAGIPISEEYANASRERGTDGGKVDSNNLYGIALSHSTVKKYDAAKVRNSWNTYTDVYYWDAKDREDKLENVYVWRGLCNEAKNKVAILIP